MNLLSRTCTHVGGFSGMVIVGSASSESASKYLDVCTKKGHPLKGLALFCCMIPAGVMGGTVAGWGVVRVVVRYKTLTITALAISFLAKDSFSTKAG